MVYQGELTLQIVQDLVYNVGLAVKEHDCFLVLSDFRAARLAMSITDLYELPKLVEGRSNAMGFSAMRLKRALVILPNAYEKFRFFETVSLNNMQTVKLFTDEKQAKEWLLGK